MDRLKKIYKIIRPAWQFRLLISILIILFVLIFISTNVQESVSERIAVFLLNSLILLIYMFILSIFEVYLFLLVFIYKEFNNFPNLWTKSLIKWSEKSQNVNNIMNGLLENKRIEKDFYSTLESYRESIQEFKDNEPKKFSNLKIYLKSIKNSNDRLAFFNIINAIIGGFAVRYLSEPDMIYNFFIKYDQMLGMDNVKKDLKLYPIDQTFIESLSYLSIIYIAIRIVYIIYTYFNNFKISLMLEIMDNTKESVRFNKRNIHNRRIKRTKKRFK